MELGLSRTIRVPRDLQAVSIWDRDGESDPREAGLDVGAPQRIWKRVEGLYRSGVYPAITLCIRRHGRVILHRAIGHSHGNGPGDAADAPRVLASPETPMCLFSASKAVTAMLVHGLNEECRLNLLDPVSHYVPEFARHGKGGVTIRDILCHRAGVPVLPAGLDPELVFDHAGFLELLCDAKPAAPGSTRQAYHAVTGGFILAELVERITGAGIRQYLRERIRAPLGFEYFDYGARDGQRAQIATNYHTGLPLPFPVSTLATRALNAPWSKVVRLSNDPRFLDAVIPAGNVIATADELCRFFEMLRLGGELDGVRVFRPLTVRRATTEIDRIRFDRTLMVPMRYSAGLMLGSNPIGLFGPDTGSAFGHLGFMNIFGWADPARALSVGLLTSGKTLLGTHLLPLARLLATISSVCPRVTSSRCS